MIKLLLIISLIIILYNLGKGLLYIIKDQSKSDKTVKALTMRIILSIGLFLLILLLIALGIIQPHGITPKQSTATTFTSELII